MWIDYNQPHHSKNSEAGLTLLDVLGALGIMIILLPALFAIIQLGLTELKKQQASEHLASVTKATSGYVRKHNERLLAESNVSSGAEFSVADLVREGFLPQGFQPVNVWGQSYRVYVREPRTNELQAIVLTSGGRGADDRDRAFASIVVPAAATMLGGIGGFIPAGDIAGQTAGTLHGSYGGWIIPLAGMGIPSPGAGHLGTVATFDQTSLSQDFLYRINVPGHPELNAMQTELDMTDHAIEKVKEMQFVPHDLTEMGTFCQSAEDNGRFFLHGNEGLYLCRDGKIQALNDTGNSLMVKYATLASHGERIRKPVCPPNVDVHPEIFVTPVSQAAGASAAPIVAMQAWASNATDTEWQINLRILTADPDLGTQQWIYPTAEYGRVQVLTLCSPSRP